MRIFTLGLLTSFLFTLTSLSTSAQNCFTPTGMTAQPYRVQGQAYMYIQFAIPGSKVTLLNANGHVTADTAGPTGVALIKYDYSKAPITGVLSVTTTGESCFMVQFAQEVILPVKFESFTVESAAGGALLEWSTSYEFNNAKYIVEKSADGRSYQAIGEVAGKETSIELNRYTFTDASFKSGDVAF